LREKERLTLSKFPRLSQYIMDVATQQYLR
jgi:hypothetical protein